MQRVLATEGNDIEVAGDGLDALRLGRDRSFDLVLDAMLPGFDGVNMCRRLRARGPITVLMLIALSGTEERVRGLDSG